MKRKRKVRTSNSAKQRKKEIHYLLPLQWSLYFVMTQSEWKDFRNRVKAIHPDWQTCSCPQGCLADTCDEKWKYDKRRHVKQFVEARFICRGCNWLKTPQLRVSAWLKQESGRWSPPLKPPHIISCLGWTEEQVQKLRGKDLEELFLQDEQMTSLEDDVKKGMAQIAYWTVDLSSLKQYGYSDIEIAVLGAKMFARAHGKG